MNKRQNNKAAIIAVLLLLVIGIGGVILGVVLPGYRIANASPEPSNFVNIPVATYVKSSDGESHAVDANVSLEMADGAEKPDENRMYLAIEEAMKDLEYEKLTAPGYNVAYVAEAVAKNLSEYLDEEELVGVYVTDLQSGPYRFAQPTPTADNNFSHRRQVFESLFPSMRD